MRQHFQGSTSSGLLSGLDPLRRIVNWFEISKLSSSERDQLTHTFQALARDAEVRLPISLLAIRGAQISQSIVESYSQDNDFRDIVMAESVLMLLSRSDRKRHIAIWAHNQHVAEGPVEGGVPMGHYLKAQLNDKYRAIGSLFYEGSFRTYSGSANRMVQHTVTVPPSFYLESALHNVCPKVSCVFEVAEAMRSSGIRNWMSLPKHLRIYGGSEISEYYPWPPVIVPDLWSTMLFVPSTTATTPLDEE